jgi:glycosyltransferase involved in cell wall biosynthesis
MNVVTPTWARFSSGCRIFGNQCRKLIPKLRLLSKQETISTPQIKDQSKKAPGALCQARTIVHFISSPGGGGAEAMLLNLVSAMDQKAWKTVVIVVDGRAWPESMTKLRETGAELHDLECTGFLRKMTLVKLLKLLRQIRPDVMQSWMHHADFVGGWCARLTGVRHVVWGIHCREIHRIPNESDLRAAIFRKLIGASSNIVPTRIISCSAAAMDDHLPLGYPRTALVWVPNGIDTERFLPNDQAREWIRNELSIPAEAPLIGFIGRFHEMKDLSTWLRAAALLQFKKPETHFWLCGGVEHELGDCARAALSVMPMRTQIHFSPFRPDPERVYTALDIFSLSSRTEACPMTIMEALSCGVPCVTTDVGDCARLLKGVGRVVPARDPEALARAWEETLLDKPSAKKLRHHAQENFDISAAARGYENVYEEVLKA